MSDPVRLGEKSLHPRSRESWVIPALILAVAAVSFSAIFVRLSQTPPIVLAAFRLLISSGMVVLWMLLRGVPGGWGLVGRDLALAGLSGCILGLHYTLWFTSLGQTSVASSTVLVTTHPLFILPVSYLLWRERITKAAIVGLVLALGGGAFIGGGDFRLGQEYLIGDVNAFLAAIAMGTYLLIGGVLRRRVDLASYIAVVYGAGGLTSAAAAWAFGFSLWPHPPREWLIFLAMAALPTMVGHTLFNWSLKYTQASVVSVSVLGEPIGATLLALVIFGERPGLWQVVGGALILSGVYLFVTRKKPPARREPYGSG